MNWVWGAEMYVLLAAGEAALFLKGTLSEEACLQRPYIC